jgi:hypothetical protein
MRRFDAAGIQKGNNPGLYLFPAAAGRPMIAAPGDGLATWHGAANRWRVWARFGCLPPEIFFFYCSSVWSGREQASSPQPMDCFEAVLD